MVVMKHAAIVSLVVLMAAGANAGIFCQVFCSSPPAGTSTCHDTQGTSPILSANACEDLVSAPQVFLREEGKRPASPSTDHAITGTVTSLLTTTIGRVIENRTAADASRQQPPFAPLRI